MPVCALDYSGGMPRTPARRTLSDIQKTLDELQKAAERIEETREQIARLRQQSERDAEKIDKTLHRVFPTHQVRGLTAAERARNMIQTWNAVREMVENG